MNDKPNLRAVMALLRPSLPTNDNGEINPMCAALVLAAMQASLDPATIASAVISHNREHGNLVGLLPSLPELMANPVTLDLPDWFETDFGGWSDGDDQP